MEYYLTIKKKEMLPFGTAWMDLVSIMLSEISQPENDKYHMISFISEISQPEEDKYHMISFIYGT